MTPNFVHPALLWGLALAALPALIHLINMTRQRRVRWAAMEFLLLSQKRRRVWILLRELLLLLMRMTALALAVLTIAQPIFSRQGGFFFGGERTHHVILLDDSFSMSDADGEAGVFDAAKNVVERIGAEAVRQSLPQSFTLLRFSRVGRGSQATRADLLDERVASDFSLKLEKALKEMRPSQFATGVVEPLKAVGQTLGDANGERRVLYLVSDFRQRQWNDADEAKKQLQSLTKLGFEIRFVQCADRLRSNLAVVSLDAEPGLRAAGISWFMNVAVANYGPTDVKNVSVLLSEDDKSRPAVTIEKIPAGKTVAKRFQTIFPSAGAHRVVARLSEDAVEADNARYATVDLPNDIPILLVDGEPQASGARFLQWAAAPGGATRTGLRPTLETPRYLGLKPLGGFSSVVLSNVGRLDTSAIRALEKYVADGGGVAFFLGDSCSARYYNEELFRGGEGLFPVALKGPADLPIDRFDPAPDVQFDNHFIFRIFAESRNSFLQTVLVNRYFSTVASSQDTSAAQPARTIAKLRNGAPLVVEKNFGKGRVVAFLTTAAPLWNSWAKNPSFVVIAQDLQAYLSKTHEEQPVRLVGEPIRLSLDAADYDPAVRFLPPDATAAPNASTDAKPDAKGKLEAVFDDVPQSGVYSAHLTRKDRKPETRLFAVNVDPAEGELALMEKTRLADRLRGVNYRYDLASQWQSANEEPRGANAGDAFLYALLALLVVEMIFAYTTSYHPVSRSATPSPGGRA